MASVTLSRINENSIHTHEVDTDFSTTSTNPVRNSTIADFLNNKIIYRGTIKTAEELDVIERVSGIYDVADGPYLANSGYRHFMLLHMHSEEYSKYYSIQIAVPYSSGSKLRAYIRKIDNNLQENTQSWSDWSRIYTTANKPTLAEIGKSSTAVDQAINSVYINGLSGYEGGRIYLNAGSDEYINYVLQAFGDSFRIFATSSKDGQKVLSGGGHVLFYNCLTGLLNGMNRVKAAAPPVDNTDLTNKAYVDGRIGRSSKVSEADTAYTTYMARGTALSTSTPTSITNGNICLVYS